MSEGSYAEANQVLLATFPAATRTPAQEEAYGG